MHRVVPVLLYLVLSCATSFAHDPPPPGRTEPPMRVAEAPLDLNSATVEQLDGLPGIGPALAERIVAYRREHGSFARIDQLNDVKGIGEKTLNRLRPLLVLGTP